MKVLRQHCQDQGRDFDALIRSTSMNVFLLENGADPEKATAQARRAASYQEYARGTLVATAGDIVARIEQLVDEGVNYILSYFPRVAYDHSMLHRFAEEVIPRFR